jgi:hypothetical protein
VQHRGRPAIRTLIAAAVALAFWAQTPASAHGFGQRYELPLPLSLYLAGAGAAVALSFIVIGLFVRYAPRPRGYLRLNLLAYPLGRLAARPILIAALKLLSVSLFFLVILAGFLGNQNPLRNLAPTLVWIIWWVGLAYISAFVGNLWAVINPWSTLFEWGETLCRRLAPGRGVSLARPYPKALGVWPALVLALVFSWIELVFPSPARPANIAWFVLAYSAITWTGMALFGRETWLRHGEAFSLVFGVLARFAPMAVRTSRPALCASCTLDCRDEDGECIDCRDCFRRAGDSDREWALRPLGVGLLRNERIPTSMMAAVLAILSTVLFDGVLGTPEWSQLESTLTALLPGLGETGDVLIRTVGLVVFWLLFLGAYLLTCAIMRALVEPRLPTLAWARKFAFTLVPIAIAYHLAHYLVFLLIQGQYIIPLASDPFGFGWNLLGTAGYRVDIAIVNARFAWYTAAAAIVVGHITAVCLAHIKATRTLGISRAVLRSQVPLTALMVTYTVVSLSILAEPIVESRPSMSTSGGAASPGEIRVPTDALLPQVGTGRLQAVGPGKLARQRLTYRMLGSAFHDGSRVTVADILYPYMFAYRWTAHGTAEASPYDPEVDAATALLRQRLSGVRVVGVDTASKSFRVGDVNFVRELFVVEVYLQVAPEDPEQDAEIAPPWSTLPWHLIVLMEEAVSRGWAAFSDAEAKQRGLPWLDLVRSPALNTRLGTLVEQFARDGYRPDALKSLVSIEEARKRWAALAAFYEAHGHFLVTNGPYVLRAWSPESVTLEVFRDLSYPLGVGSFDAYAIPRRAYITKVERQDEELRLFVDVETVMRFQRSYNITRQPLQVVAAGIMKQLPPHCRYVVLDSGGRVVLAGLARLAEDSTFRVDLKGKLQPGRYTVQASAYLDGNAMNALIVRIPVEISARSSAGLF